MRLKKVYEVPKGNPKPPYPFIGKFVCSNCDETENNLLASFAEHFLNSGKPNGVSVSFKPSLKDVQFWVSAKTRELVKEVIDAESEVLCNGLKKKGYKVVVVIE